MPTAIARLQLEPSPRLKCDARHGPPGATRIIWAHVRHPLPLRRDGGDQPGPRRLALDRHRQAPAGRPRPVDGRPPRAGARLRPVRRARRDPRLGLDRRGQRPRGPLVLALRRRHPRVPRARASLLRAPGRGRRGGLRHRFPAARLRRPAHRGQPSLRRLPGRAVRARVEAGGRRERRHAGVAPRELRDRHRLLPPARGRPRLLRHGRRRVPRALRGPGLQPDVGLHDDPRLLGVLPPDAEGARRPPRAAARLARRPHRRLQPAHVRRARRRSSSPARAASTRRCRSS